MRLFNAAAVLCSVLLSSRLVCAGSNASTSSVQTALPPDFQPLQVFKNVNSLRNINLEKGYARESINVVVENVDKQAHSEYYLPFPTEVFNKIGGLEVRNKKASEMGRFRVEAAALDSTRLVYPLPPPSLPFLSLRTAA